MARGPRTHLGTADLMGDEPATRHHRTRAAAAHIGGPNTAGAARGTVDAAVASRRADPEFRARLEAARRRDAEIFDELVKWAVGSEGWGSFRPARAPVALTAPGPSRPH